MGQTRVMASDQGDDRPSDHTFESTTFEWKRVKVRRPAGGQQGSRPKGARWWHLPSRNPRERLSITLKYRGGPECWYEVSARGAVGRFPGYVQLHDLMQEINGGREFTISAKDPT